MRSPAYYESKRIRQYWDARSRGGAAVASITTEMCDEARAANFIPPERPGAEDVWRMGDDLTPSPFDRSGVRVAILCPGPSLIGTWEGVGGGQFYAATIAVNIAIDAYPATWWAVQDRGPMGASKGRPTTGILTLRSRIPDFPAVTDGLAVLTTDAMPVEIGQLTTFTGLLARVFALSLGAAEIHVFGDDRGGGYYDGSPSPSSKGGRWDREADEAAHLEKWLNSRGARTTRILPALEADHGTD